MDNENIIESLPIEAFKRDALEFKKLTGYSISKFLLMLTDGRLKIEEPSINAFFSCPHCGTTHKIFLKEQSQSSLAESQAPTDRKVEVEPITNINCVVCGFLSTVPGDVSKVEIFI